MEINKRIKPRQSGKTQDVLEMAEILASIGRKVALLFPTSREVNGAKRTHKHLFSNNFNGSLIIGSATNMDFMRGHRFDCIVVDEYKNLLNQGEVYSMILITNAVLYTTET